MGRDTIRFFPADALDGKGALNPALVDELRRLGPFKLVANLPYSIATPLLLLLFASGLEIRLAIATIQKEVAERLKERIATRPFLVDETGGIALTASFGLASFPEHAQTLEELVKRADEAMYAIKRSGKNDINVAGNALDNNLEVPDGRDKSDSH